MPSKDGCSAASLDSLLQGYTNFTLVRVGFCALMPNQKPDSCSLKCFLSCSLCQGELTPSLKRYIYKYTYVYICTNICVYICMYVCLHTLQRRKFSLPLYIYIYILSNINITS